MKNKMTLALFVVGVNLCFVGLCGTVAMFVTKSLLLNSSDSWVVIAFDVVCSGFLAVVISALVATVMFCLGVIVVIVGYDGVTALVNHQTPDVVLLAGVAVLFVVMLVSTYYAYIYSLDATRLELVGYWSQLYVYRKLIVSAIAAADSIGGLLMGIGMVFLYGDDDDGGDNSDKPDPGLDPDFERPVWQGPVNRIKPFLQKQHDNSRHQSQNN